MRICTLPLLLPLVILPGILFSCKTNSADTPSSPENNPPQTNMPPPEDQQPDKKPGEQPDKKPVASDFVGMQLSAAEKLANQHRIKHRVVMRDGKSFPITMDYRPDRVNFTVENGVVTKVTNG